MIEIEVTWEVKPKSGITSIDIEDLGCKNKREFDALDKKEQEKRINEYLEDSESYIRALAKEW